MNKRIILATGTLIVGAMLVGLLVSAVSLAAPLVPDTDLSQADASFVGESRPDQSGYSVAGTGDVNGDGYDDFLIGAPGDYDGGAEAGQTYLILGQESGWAMDTDLSLADASFWGEETGDQSGCSVAGAGDVNGDGYRDFLIGSRRYDASTTVTDTGKTYLVLGQASGWAMDIDLSLADASFLGESTGDQSGHSVAGAGDVDGDGYDDFLIGAPYNDSGGADAGQTYLILGRPTISWTAGMSLTVDADASFLGENGGDQSGYSVAGAGDVNGDSYDDFLVGAPHNDGGGADAGQTYLILGRPTIGWTVGMSLTVDADASFLGENGDDWAGYSVAGAGDVNGDGYDDFLIGAWRNDEHGSNAGQTYLILGRAAADWGMGFSLSNANASFQGEVGSDWSGWSVSGAGDVNGDGHDDFLIGAYGNDAGGSIAGQTYLTLGRAAADWGMDFDLSNADASFWGEGVSDWSGWSVSGAGDANGDGYDDFLIGARYNSEGGSQAGQTYLVFGNGLSLSKIASFDPLSAGEVFTYTLSYANTMYVNATGVLITDSVPANTIYVDCDGGQSCSESGGVVTWNIGDVISQTSGVVTLTLQVNSALCEDLIITNTAHILATNIYNPLSTTVTNTVVVTPTANFTSSTPVCLGAAMFFTDTSQCAVAWSWDFGDGIGTSNAQNPNYTYTGAGDYTVTLTATNTSGHSDSHQATVTVNPIPTAGFTSNSPVCLGETMTFTNTSTGATSYQWNFGDGQGSTAENPTHDYAAAGSYTVVLTATNSATGCFDVYSDTVVVNALPTAGFTSNSPVCLGETMTFTNTSTGATSYRWNFGDGQGSTATSPSHDYAAVGNYTVVLTATNAAGCFDVYSDTVTVIAGALDHIVVSPSSVTLAPGETQLFTATGYDQCGNQVSGLTFTWEVVSGGGTIDSSGVFTAGTTAGQYTDTVRATANGVSGYASVTVSGYTQALFLPIILKDYVPPTPDLVVDDIIVTNPGGAAGIQVVIRNQGNAAVNDEFWVDFYIDPNPPPDGINQTWDYPPGRCAEGLVWGVVASALPIMPGDNLTLTYGGQYYDPSRSNFSGSFTVRGHNIYAQVDSANVDTTYGAVLENHEIIGGAYNNIRGEVLNVVASGGAASPPPVAKGQAAPETLPPRPEP